MNNDELEDLIGREDEDGDNQCARCGKLYPVKAGDYRTKYCEECGRELILQDREIPENDDVADL